MINRLSRVRPWLLCPLLLVMTSGCLDAPPVYILSVAPLNAETCAPVQDQRLTSSTIDLTLSTDIVLDLIVANDLQLSSEERLMVTSARIAYQLPENIDLAVPEAHEVPLPLDLPLGRDTVVELEILGGAFGGFLSTALDARDTSIPLKVEIELLGATGEGIAFRSNVFRYPIELCRGCQLEFPLTNAAEYCAKLDEPSDSMSCRPGHDEPIDCRYCTQAMISEGYSERQANLACGPL